IVAELLLIICDKTCRPSAEKAMRSALPGVAVMNLKNRLGSSLPVARSQPVTCWPLPLAMNWAHTSRLSGEKTARSAQSQWTGSCARAEISGVEHKKRPKQPAKRKGFMTQRSSLFRCGFAIKERKVEKNSSAAIRVKMQKPNKVRRSLPDPVAWTCTLGTDRR